MQRLINAVAAVDRWLERLERTILAIGVIALAALNVSNAVGRYVFNSSLTFAEEVNQILLIVITFLGIGFAARLGRHIRMSALYDQLGGKPRKALQTLTTAGTAFLLGLLAYYATLFVISQSGFGGSTPALGIPWYLVYIVVPVGLAIGSLQYLLATIRNLISPGIYASFIQKEEYDHGQGTRGSGL